MLSRVRKATVPEKKAALPWRNKWTVSGHHDHTGRGTSIKHDEFTRNLRRSGYTLLHDFRYQRNVIHMLSLARSHDQGSQGIIHQSWGSGSVFQVGTIHKWKPRFPLPDQISRTPPDHAGYDTTALEEKPHGSTISKLSPMRFISPAKLHTAAPAR